MDFFLVVIMFAFFAFGFVIIGKLDKFIASPYFHPDIKDINSCQSRIESALIFGRLMISQEIADELNKCNIPYTMILDTNELNKSESYRYLFAVDESDLENLMICSITEKMMGIKERIAICNSIDNRRIFEDNHIPYLFGGGISASRLTSSLLSSSLKAGGKSDV